MNIKKSNSLDFEDLYSFFKNKYGKPDCIIQSPGRVNIIGEHTDYNGGMAIPFACNKYLWFVAKKNASQKVNIHAANLEERKTINFESEAHDSRGFDRFFLSVIKILREKGISLTGLDLVFGGDLPIGAGMSSSSSLTCGFLYLLNTMFGLGFSRTEMVDMASLAENNTGVEGGKMDQITILHGKKDHALFIDFYYHHFEYLPLNNDVFNFALIDSKTKHSLVETEYNSRRKECQDLLFEINSFHNQNKKIRHLDYSLLKSMKNSKNTDRLKFVLSENNRVTHALSSINNEDSKQLGELMNDSHTGLSKLYNVSCEELDFIVSECSALKNILGARIMGGGFGGCALTLITQDFDKTALVSMKEKYFKQYSHNLEIFYIKSSDGCKVI